MRRVVAALGALDRLGVDLRFTHLGWALFRIGYHAAVLWLLADLWIWRESAFASALSAGPSLVATGLIVNVLLVAGWRTRPLLVVNAALLRAVFLLSEDPYTVDEIVENMSLVLVFAPRPRALAVDCAGQPAAPREPLPAHFCALVYVALVLLYGDSVIHKLTSVVWRDGSIVWLAAAMPHAGSGFYPDWAQEAWIARAAAYGALAYEALFPLIVIRRLRPILAAVGIAMHAGTAVLYPLPQFALVMVSTLLLLVPRPAPGAKAPPARREVATLAYILAAAMTVSQIGLVLHPWDSRGLLARLVSTYPHPFFVDWHFRLRAPILRYTVEVDGRTVEIPSFDLDGRPVVRDRYWKVLAFSLRGDRRGRDMMSRYVRAWLVRHGIGSARVTLWCRDVTLPRLELDFSLADVMARRSFQACGAIDLGPGPGG